MPDGPLPPDPNSTEVAVRLPHITVSSLKQVFEALRQGDDIQNHPFLNLHWFRQYSALDIALHEPITSIMLFDVLSSVVTTSLERLRCTFELPPLNTNLTARQAVIDLASVAQTGNRYLIGGSAVFYRYVRYDLDWRIEQITQYLGQSRRTTQRSMNDFWNMLMNILIRLEANTLGIDLNILLHQS